MFTIIQLPACGISPGGLVIDTILYVRGALTHFGPFIGNAKIENRTLSAELEK